MTDYLLYNKKSHVTAKLLARSLGLRFTSNHSRFSNPPVIRYGNSFGNYSHDTTLNSSDAITLVSNSTLFSKFCCDNNILSPTYTKFNINTEYEFPFLLRKKYHHGGKDIVFISSREDLDNAINNIDISNMFHVPFYDTSYEVRLHVLFNNVERLFIKKSDCSDSGFIRSSYFGWRYSLRSDESKYKSARIMALDLVEKLGISFCAIDMAFIPDRSSYIVWEVNSAPGLNSNTLELYRNKLRSLV